MRPADHDTAAVAQGPPGCSTGTLLMSACSHSVAAAGAAGSVKRLPEVNPDATRSRAMSVADASHHCFIW
jgi:hypothetical protein